MKTIKLAFRSLLHFRMYSGINLLGMALSLACVIIIFRYVYGEFSVDRFNKKLDRIYVTTMENSARPGHANFWGMFNPNKEKTFVDLTEHPGVERSSQIILFKEDEIDCNNRRYNTTTLFTDSNFLKITDYPVIAGVEKLSDPKSVLITQSFAQKVFGDKNPVGQTFMHSTGEILTITGVIGQTSTKSTLSFDIVVSSNLQFVSYKSPQTLVLLYPNVDYRTINKQYGNFFEMPHWQQSLRYQLFPLSKVYFDKSIDENYVFKRGNYNHVRLLIAAGILILLIGVVSYINISTVVVLRRGRELGVKKVFGAEGYNIFIQLAVENLLTIGLALILAFLFANMAHPLIANVLQLDLIYNIRFDLFLSFVTILSLPVITTLYPFFRYYYSTPVNSLHSFDKIRGAGSLRRIFLSFQYIITIVMIVVSLFFIKQVRFMLNAEPGYRTKDIIKAQFFKNEPRFSQIKSVEDWQIKHDRDERIAGEIEQKMNACPLFLHWTYGKSPNEFLNGGFPFKLPEGKYINVNLTGVDESWLRLFEIPLKEGRLWDDKTDNFFGYFLIVTESLLKLYGITDFSNALLQPEQRIAFIKICVLLLLRNCVIRIKIYQQI